MKVTLPGKLRIMYFMRPEKLYSITQIYKEEGMTAGLISKLIKELIAEGYIQRVDIKRKDTRRKYFKLTPKGDRISVLLAEIKEE